MSFLCVLLAFICESIVETNKCIYSNVNVFTDLNTKNTYLWAYGYSFDVMVTNDSCIPSNYKHYNSVYPPGSIVSDKSYNCTKISSIFCA